MQQNGRRFRSKRFTTKDIDRYYKPGTLFLHRLSHQTTRRMKNKAVRSPIVCNIVIPRNYCFVNGSQMCSPIRLKPQDHAAIEHLRMANSNGSETENTIMLSMPSLIVCVAQFACRQCVSLVMTPTCQTIIHYTHKLAASQSDCRRKDCLLQHVCVLHNGVGATTICKSQMRRLKLGHRSQHISYCQIEALHGATTICKSCITHTPTEIILGHQSASVRHS